MYKKIWLLVAITVIAWWSISAQTEVHNAEAGKLSEVLEFNNIKADTLTKLKITGIMDARDFTTLRPAYNTLEHIDISEISISAYTDGEYERWANSIPISAFEDFSVLHTVMLPDPEVSCNPIIDIHLSAFRNCSSLQHIKFPNSLRSISDRAFMNSALRQIHLPDSLKWLGYKAFESCHNITSVHIPEDVNYIGMGAFAICSRLAEITVAESNKDFSSLDGILYTQNKYQLVQYPAGKGEERFVFYPDTKAIQKNAFDGCRLKEIVFPDTIFVSTNDFRTLKETLETVRINYFHTHLLLPNTLKSIYFSDTKIPEWSMDWIYGLDQIDLISKITLYVHPDLIKSYKQSPLFGTHFNYVAWIPTGITDTKKLNFTIYPNPAKADIYFDFAGLSPCSMQIYDISGKLVHSAKLDLSDTTYKTNVNDLHLNRKGLYLVKVNTDKGTIIRKLSVE